MRAGTFGKLAIVAAVGAAAVAVAKSLRGEPTPVFSNHPTVTGGPAPKPVAVPTPVAEPEPAPVAAAEPEPKPEPEPKAKAKSAPAAPAAASAEQAWVLPVDGECPDGYPVKAKVKSGIFHQPGTPTYERTKPDRCYPSVEAAEADGLRAPKR